MKKSEKFIMSVYILSILGFLLGNIGVVVLKPNSQLWFISGLSAMLGLTGMLGALASKVLKIIIIRVSEEENV